MLDDKFTAAAAAHAGLTLAPGRRVHDSISSFDGVVISGAIIQRTMSAPKKGGGGNGAGAFSVPASEQVETYMVKLDTGELVKRAAGELLALPDSVPGVIDEFLA